MCRLRARVQLKTLSSLLNCFLLAGRDTVGSLANVEFTIVWCGSLADSLLQLSFVFSFALIEFSLKRFPSFFDYFMPAELSRFGTLAEFEKN